MNLRLIEHNRYKEKQINITSNYNNTTFLTKPFYTPGNNIKINNQIYIINRTPVDNFILNNIKTGALWQNFVINHKCRGTKISKKELITYIFTNVTFDAKVEDVQTDIIEKIPY